jgi:hypothetical protein
MAATPQKTKEDTAHMIKARDVGTLAIEVAG